MSLSVCMSQIETPVDPDMTRQIYSPFYPSLLPPQCSCIWKFVVERARIHALEKMCRNVR